MSNKNKRNSRPINAGKGLSLSSTGGDLDAAAESGRADAEITVFLSYSRADDRVYRMVRPFKDLLAHFVHAKSGRRIRTFLDQESISWGEIWKGRLETEILGASVFIPLLSANYLESEMCRLEFNKFQSSATGLGVKELLLPVLLIDAPVIFNSTSPDDIVREAASRDWEIIEDAVLADAGSSQWKRTMARIADRFVTAYDLAEARLANFEDLSDARPLSDLGRLEELYDEDDPGLAELMESIEAEIGDLTEIAQSLAPAIQDLGAAASNAGHVGQSTSTQQIQAWSVRAARAFEAPAVTIGDLGERMLVTAKALDVDMQQLRRFAVEFPALAGGYNSMLSQLTGIDSVASQLDQLLVQMRPAEVVSVPLRRALRPVRLGLTRVTDSLRLIQTWQPA